MDEGHKKLGAGFSTLESAQGTHREVALLLSNRTKTQLS